jgi:hypothetical protein
MIWEAPKIPLEPQALHLVNRKHKQIKIGVVHIMTLLWVQFSKSLYVNKRRISKDKKSINSDNMALRLLAKSLIEFIETNLVTLITKRYLKEIDRATKIFINRKIIEHSLTILRKGFGKCKKKCKNEPIKKKEQDKNKIDFMKSLKVILIRNKSN